jgi:hypothetical protein
MGEESGGDILRPVSTSADGGDAHWLWNLRDGALKHPHPNLPQKSEERILLVGENHRPIIMLIVNEIR